MFFLLVEGGWEEVGHTHTHSHVCTVAWTHLFTLKHHLHGHTQVHTHPNTQAHTLKYMNTPTHICKQTGHTYAHMHTHRLRQIFTHACTHAHVCTQAHPPHLENCMLRRWGHCPHPPGAGASRPSPLRPRGTAGLAYSPVRSRVCSYQTRGIHSPHLTPPSRGRELVRGPKGLAQCSREAGQGASSHGRWP